MGQTADDAVEGFACSWCGIYFEESHGYPVICTGCFKEWKKNEGIGSESKAKKALLEKYALQVATNPELG